MQLLLSFHYLFPPVPPPCRVNDRLISANGLSLEGVEYARAVQVLRDSGASVQLLVRRRVVLPTASPQTLTVTLTRTRKKEGLLGTELGEVILTKIKAGAG